MEQISESVALPECEECTIEKISYSVALPKCEECTMEQISDSEVWLGGGKIPLEYENTPSPAEIK